MANVLICFLFVSLGFSGVASASPKAKPAARKPSSDEPTTREILEGIAQAIGQVGSQQVFVSTKDGSIKKVSVADVMIQALSLSDRLKIEKTCTMRGGRHQGVDTYDCTINFGGQGPMDGSSFIIKANAEVDSAKNQDRVTITGNVGVSDIAG